MNHRAERLDELALKWRKMAEQGDNLACDHDVSEAAMIGGRLISVIAEIASDYFVEMREQAKEDADRRLTP